MMHCALSDPLLSCPPQREVPACLVELRALQVVDLSHNDIRTIGDQFERIINLHTLDLSGNEDLDVDSLLIRTRRLHEKVSSVWYSRLVCASPMQLSVTSVCVCQQQLLKSKCERRALIQRALGVRKDVLLKEQQAILEGRERGSLEFP